MRASVLKTGRLINASGSATSAVLNVSHSKKATSEAFQVGSAPKLQIQTLAIDITVPTT